MQTSAIKNTPGGGRSQAGGKRVSLVKRDDERIREIQEVLPEQTRGIVARELWASNNHKLRIIPGVDKATGDIYPQNVKVNEYSTEADYREYLSDTFYEATVVAGLCGNPLVVADYHPESDAARQFGSNTVLRCFINTIYNTVKYEKDGKKVYCKGIPAWKAWVAMRGPLQLPRRAFLMQSILFSVNGRALPCGAVMKDAPDPQAAYVDANGEPKPVLGVAAITQKLSVTNLLQALVEPSNPGMNLNAITNNKYGGMAEADGNILFLNAVQSGDGKHYLKPSVQEAGKGWSPTPWPLDPDIIRVLWTPWEDLLNFLTPDEQIQMLVPDFGADTINYVIGTDPRLSGVRIPDDVWSFGLGRYEEFVDPKRYGERCALQNTQTIRLTASTPVLSPAVPKVSLMPTTPASTPTPVLGLRKPAPVAKEGAFRATGGNALSMGVQEELRRMREAGVGTSTEDGADLASGILADADSDEFDDDFDLSPDEGTRNLQGID